MATHCIHKNANFVSHCMAGSVNVTTTKGAKRDDVCGVRTLGGFHRCQMNTLILLPPDQVSWLLGRKTKRCALLMYVFGWCITKSGAYCCCPFISLKQFIS